MTYFGLINFPKCKEWKLGVKSPYMMTVFADLESWANPVKSDDPTDNRPYYLLYREKILKDIPYLGSVSSISRSILELETKGIIESINKHYAPAYRLTEKGLSWKRKPELENSNDGESAEQPQPKTPPKERKKNKFVLSSKKRVEDLSKEYMSDLFQSAMQMAIKHNIPNAKEEFEKFLEHHSKNGNKWANWLSAFSTWCRNNKKFNEPNGGENNDNGLYQ